MLMLPITLTVALYSVAWLVLIRSLRSGHANFPVPTQILVWLGLFVHLFAIYRNTVFPEGLNIGFFTAISLFFWTTNLLIALSSLKKPLQNLLVLTLPITVLAMLLNMYIREPDSAAIFDLDVGVASHIFLSILAYSAMFTATFQALLLAFQDNRIRAKHPTGLVRMLPPLQTMETLLFEILWFGEILLTLVIITGFFHTENIAAQQLTHKIVFTVIAWVIYAVLLWGRHAMGWRGASAIRWTLSGFAFLILAYLGSKLVLEFILDKSV